MSNAKGGAFERELMKYLREDLKQDVERLGCVRQGSLPERLGKYRSGVRIGSEPPQLLGEPILDGVGHGRRSRGSM